MNDLPLSIDLAGHPQRGFPVAQVSGSTVFPTFRYPHWQMAMEIYIGRDGRQRGPYSLAEVQRMLGTGEVAATDLAWAPGQVGWGPLSSIPGMVPAVPPPLGPAGPPPLRPSTAAASVPFSSPAVPTAMVYRAAPTSTLSVVSLVLGIVSLTMMPIVSSIPAVVCGHLARSEIRRSNGTISGDGLALAGLITGYASLALWGVIMAILGFIMVAGVAVAPGILQNAMEKSNEQQALDHGRQIVVACHRYARDHQGAYPPDLESLVPEYLRDRSVFVSQLQTIHDPMGFEYLGGSSKDAPSKVIFYSKVPNVEGKRVVGRVDGSVRLQKWSLQLESHGEH